MNDPKANFLLQQFAIICAAWLVDSKSGWLQNPSKKAERRVRQHERRIAALVESANAYLGLMGAP